MAEPKKSIQNVDNGSEKIDHVGNTFSVRSRDGGEDKRIPIRKAFTMGTQSAGGGTTVGVPGVAQSIVSLLRENINSLANLIIVILILTLELIFDKAIFQCPCSRPYNTAYGSLFLLAPAVAFFVVGASSAVLTTAPGLSAKAYSTVTGNSSSIINTFIVLLVLAAEALFDKTLFVCPCDKPARYYGWLFLFGPCAAFFIFGILINNTTWYLITGCCRRYPSTYHGYRLSCFLLLGIVWRALVAPLAWLFFGLLDGRYYQCAMATMPCSTASAYTEENARLRVTSQIIGWSMLTAAVVLALAGLIFWRTCNRLTMEQDRYMHIYRKMERLEIERQFEEHAHAVAKENVSLFLQKAKRYKKDWDEIAMVPTLTPKLSEPAEEKYTALAGKMHKEHSDSSIAMNDRTQSISTKTSDALDGHDDDDHTRNIMTDQTDLNPRANMGFIQHR